MTILPDRGHVPKIDFLAPSLMEQIGHFPLPVMTDDSGMDQHLVPIL